MANEIARTLRKNMTPQEVKLWVHLRALKEQGFHFRRQVPIGSYIVDFAEKTKRVVIEVDGSQHGFDGHGKADMVRDATLEKRFYRVLRFWNIDIDAEIDGVMLRILEALNEPHPRHATGPSSKFAKG